ncbi:MAG TPA: penicillin-binding protein 2 [Polyangiaceae bacterium LLY-WYZ-14_1]|nr:penicillin-binding protein 2 [Polyangiaceae bacterium LLY-WYZ-14_1]
MSTILSPRREVGEFRKRYKWMALVVLVVFGGLGVRAFQLQVAEVDRWKRTARENITKTITLPATRGLIRDADGRIVAANRPAYDVYITPQRFDVERDLPALVAFLGLSLEEQERLRERVASIEGRRRSHQIPMIRNLDRDQLAALETHANDLRGVDVIATPVRTYPYGRLGAHAVGYLNEVNADDLERRRGQGYRAGDRLGRTGVEHSWEAYLRGRRGYDRVLVDVRGRRQDIALEDQVPGFKAGRREPEPGRDLGLTLDMELMETIDRAFRGHPSGGAVVVEIDTGRVRALFSKPSYDPQEMTGRLSPERFRELRDDPFRPLIDKTVYESYFPGSTFKPVTALAALAEDLVDPHFSVDCPGFYEVGNRKFRCNQVHRTVDIVPALSRSCNVYFWQVAERVGLDRLARWAKDLGLGTPTGLGLNSEASGFIPTRDWYRRRFGERFRLGFTLNASIGQGNVRTTLLQLAMTYAALANGGKLHAPLLVEEVRAPGGRVLQRFEPRLRRRLDVDPKDLRLILDGLYGVVNDPTGTAWDARIKGGVEIAGKTATAQLGRRTPKPGEDPARSWYLNRDHAWFVGYAPFDNPEVVAVVLVEHGGAGGKAAAPIAIQILQEYLGEEGDDDDGDDGRLAAAPGRKAGAPWR